MNKTSMYIQKLIALILVLVVGIILSHEFPVVYYVYFLFLTFGYMVFRISSEKPPYLWNWQKTDDLLNSRSGLWILFKWLLSAVGFAYDLVVWTIFGIYVLYTILVDFILLIKTLIYWIVHAVLWFLKKLVPAVVFIWKMLIYYGFRWQWWVYKLTFRNVGISYNWNSYKVGLYGAIPGLFIWLLFLGLGFFVHNYAISFIGVIFGLLPVFWSFAEIASMRHFKREYDTFTEIRKGFAYGTRVIRIVLIYFLIFLCLVLAQVALNLLGWIPSAGLVFMGIAININTLASLILLFVSVVYLFSVFILPAYVVKESHNFSMKTNLSLLRLTVWKFLRYLSSIIPASFFALIMSAIPALIVAISVILTLNIKNRIIDTRISILKEKQVLTSDPEQYRTVKNIERLEFYREFPGNMFSRPGEMEKIKNRYGEMKAFLSENNYRLKILENKYQSEIDSLKKQLSRFETVVPFDSAEISGLRGVINEHQKKLNSFRDASFRQSQKLEIDLSEMKNKLVQLPFAFLLTIIWIAVFGGLVMAILISYLGNVYYELYGLKEDDKPSFFTMGIYEQNRLDPDQPLLGFTLLGIIIMAVSVILILF